MPDPSTPVATKSAAQTREPSIERTNGRRPESPPELTGHDVYFSLGPGVARAASVATTSGDPTIRSTVH